MLAGSYVNKLLLGLIRTAERLPGQKYSPGASWDSFWLPGGSLGKNVLRDPPGSHFGCRAAPWAEMLLGSLLGLILAAGRIPGPKWETIPSICLT